jgi:hypothetical protein
MPRIFWYPYRSEDHFPVDRSLAGFSAGLFAVEHLKGVHAARTSAEGDSR